MDLDRVAALPGALDEIQLGERYKNVTLRVRLPSRQTTWANMVGHFGWEELPTNNGRHCMGPTFHREFPSGQTVMYALHTASQIMEIVTCRDGDAPRYEHPQRLRSTAA